MRRIEKRLFRINDELAALYEAERQAREELVFHRHLDDDAQRDAAGGSPLDRADARETAADVARLEASIADLAVSIGAAEAKRAALLERLA